MSGPKAFILHLERAVSRKANVQALKGTLPIESEVVGAVDGALLSQAAVDQAYTRRRFEPRYPFALTATEVGVFLSHRAAWRRIVDEALDFAFIFEDDAEIEPGAFAALMAFVAAERDGLGLCAHARPADPGRDGGRAPRRAGAAAAR